MCAARVGLSHSLWIASPAQVSPCTPVATVFACPCAPAGIDLYALALAAALMLAEGRGRVAGPVPFDAGRN